MDLLRHWLIGGHDTSDRQPTVITDPALAERWARRGEEVLGPFVLEADGSGAVSGCVQALREQAACYPEGSQYEHVGRGYLSAADFLEALHRGGQ